jgi:hypothetical protein
VLSCEWIWRERKPRVSATNRQHAPSRDSARHYSGCNLAHASTRSAWDVGPKGGKIRPKQLSNKGRPGVLLPHVCEDSDMNANGSSFNNSDRMCLFNIRFNQWLALLLRIRWFPGSNQGSITGYSGRFFVSSTSNPWPIASKPFPVHHLLIALSFEALYSYTALAMLN